MTLHTTDFAAWTPRDLESWLRQPVADDAPERPPRPAEPPRTPVPWGRYLGAPLSRSAALADLGHWLARGTTIPSQTALCQRWGRPKQTVSDWLKAWEAAGLIPRRRTDGRRKTLAKPAR